MTITSTFAALPQNGYVLSHGTITFDNSYASGGEPLTAALVGLDFVDKILLTVRAGANQPYRVTYDRTNKKLIVQSSELKIRHGQVDGGAAGNITCTGVVAATDVIKRVMAVCANVATPAFKYKDVTAEFAVCADNTIGNAAGTATVNGCLLIDYWRPADQEVANATDLSALVVDFIAYQFNDKIV